MGTMKIVVIDRQRPDEWTRAIRAANGDHEVFDGREPHDLAAIDVIVLGGIPAARSAADWMLPYKNVRLIQSLWMGVDRFVFGPLPGSAMVARMVDPGMPTAMTESVLAHVLAAHRQHDVYRRQQQDGVWLPHPQPLAHQRTVGILGFGVLGRRCADALVALGFQVCASSRSGDAQGTTHQLLALDDLLGVADIIVNLLPLTPATEGLLNRDFFAKAKPGMVLINVGRGRHVVEDDLLAALDSAVVRHAFLDVFRDEPLEAGHPFWTHPRVTVTPHVAAESQLVDCVPVVAENIRLLALGRVPLHLVDVKQGY
jgi:glyoxylate/hydroxypyruvate reductase